MVRWNGDLIANKRVQCPQTEARFVPKNQPSIPEDEDCLYLNVYVPVSEHQTLPHYLTCNY